MKIDTTQELLVILEQKNTYIDMLQREIECLKQENKTLRRERDEWEASNMRAMGKNGDIMAIFKEFKQKMGRFY